MTPDAARGQGDDERVGEEAPDGGPAMPDRRVAILRTGVVVGVLVVVFGLILPQFVDYADVVAAIAALTLPEMVLISVLGALAWLASGQLFTVLVAGLTPLRGAAAYLILTGIGSSIPFGPWNMGVVWVVIRGWGVDAQPATAGVALYGITNTLGRLAFPLVAVAALALSGDLGSQGGAVTVITVISVAVFVVATVTLAAIVRSDRAADWLGRTLRRVLAWLFERLHREGSPDVTAGINRFRGQLGELARRRGLAALLVTIASQLPWCVVFIVALRLTGVPGDVVTPADVVAVFALVSVITIIPISPGGAGIPELLYIAALTAIAGPSYEAAITAGVFLFRLYVWFLPIPLAWLLLKVVRRGQPMLPTGAELRSYAAAGPA